MRCKSVNRKCLQARHSYDIKILRMLQRLARRQSFPGIRDPILFARSVSRAVRNRGSPRYGRSRHIVLLLLPRRGCHTIRSRRKRKSSRSLKLMMAVRIFCKHHPRCCACLGTAGHGQLVAFMRRFRRAKCNTSMSLDTIAGACCEEHWQDGQKAFDGGLV